jgi:hypothetical protein
MMFCGVICDLPVAVYQEIYVTMRNGAIRDSLARKLMVPYVAVLLTIKRPVNPLLLASISNLGDAWLY